LPVALAAHQPPPPEPETAAMEPATAAAPPPQAPPPPPRPPPPPLTKPAAAATPKPTAAAVVPPPLPLPDGAWPEAASGLTPTLAVIAPAGWGEAGVKRGLRKHGLKIISCAQAPQLRGAASTGCEFAVQVRGGDACRRLLAATAALRAAPGGAEAHERRLVGGVGGWNDLLVCLPPLPPPPSKEPPQEPLVDGARVTLRALVRPDWRPANVQRALTIAGVRVLSCNPAHELRSAAPTSCVFRVTLIFSSFVRAMLSASASTDTFFSGSDGDVHERMSIMLFPPGAHTSRILAAGAAPLPASAPKPAPAPPALVPGGPATISTVAGATAAAGAAVAHPPPAAAGASPTGGAGGDGGVMSLTVVAPVLWNVHEVARGLGQHGMTVLSCAPLPLAPEVIGFLDSIPGVFIATVRADAAAEAAAAASAARSAIPGAEAALSSRLMDETSGATWRDMYMNFGTGGGVASAPERDEEEFVPWCGEGDIFGLMAALQADYLAYGSGSDDDYE
jgi:hypothetical protein